MAGAFQFFQNTRKSSFPILRKPWPRKILMNTESVPIASLRHAEYNPRKITPRDFEQIKRSIMEFGLIQPLVVNRAPGREGVIIGGNQRFEVMKALGHTMVDVVWVNISDMAREKELNVRLNRNHADWDWDILSKEFIIDDLADWGFNSKEINFNFDIDKEETSDVPEPSKEPRAQRGKIYTLGR